MKTRVYIAGPLFSRAETDYNRQVKLFLQENGFTTFLPQEDGYELSELVRKSDPEEASDLIFRHDLEELKRSDILVFVMDGRVPDEGACIETGIAYALGKECYGLKTDTRTLLNSRDNPMILGAVQNRVAHSFDELLELITGRINP